MSQYCCSVSVPAASGSAEVLQLRLQIHAVWNEWRRVLEERQRFLGPPWRPRVFASRQEGRRATRGHELQEPPAIFAAVNRRAIHFSTGRCETQRPISEDTASANSIPRSM